MYPPNFTDEQLQDLQKIQKEHHGEEITLSETRIMANNLYALHEWTQELMRSGRVDHLIEQQEQDDTLSDNS